MQISTTVLNAGVNKVKGFNSLIQSNSTYYNAQAVDNRLSIDRATLNTLDMNDYAEGFAFLVTEAWGVEYYVIDQTHKVLLVVDGGVAPDEQDGTFTDGVNGMIELDSSIFFAVLSGASIIGLQVISPRFYPNAVTDGQFDRDDLIIIEEGFATISYLTNGTFTVNNITVTIAVAVQEVYYGIKYTS